MQCVDSTAAAGPPFSGPYPAFQAALSQPDAPTPGAAPDIKQGNRQAQRGKRSHETRVTKHGSQAQSRGGATKPRSQAQSGKLSHETPSQAQSRGGAMKRQSQAQRGKRSHETLVKRGPKDMRQLAQSRESAAAPSTLPGVAKRAGRRGLGCVEDSACTGPTRVLRWGPEERHTWQRKLHSLHRPFLAFYSLKKPPKEKESVGFPGPGTGGRLLAHPPRPLPGPSGWTGCGCGRPRSWPACQ